MTTKHRADRPVRWTARAGAWLGIGTSPAALVLGAALATRHGGPVPVVGIAVGLVLMAVLLWFQGLLGVRPPWGENQDLSGLSRRYLGRAGRRVLAALLVVSLSGWAALNLSIGAAALAALSELPTGITAVVLGVPIVVLSGRGVAGWNRFAWLTTLSSVALVGLVVTHVKPTAAPLALTSSPAGLVALDVAALIGYVAVFSVRAPDFTVGLGDRRDLGMSITLLCGSTLVVVLAGAALGLRFRSHDLAGTLLATGLTTGNVLLTVSVIAPTLTSLHSGILAARALLPRLELPAAVAVIGLPSVVVASTRFDLLILPWLSALAAALPAFIVPFVIAASLRRRGIAIGHIPTWTWAPASALATVLAATGAPYASVVGPIVAAAAISWWARRELGASGRGGA